MTRRLLTCEIGDIIIGVMYTPDLENPDELHAFLSDVLLAVYHALDHGVSFAERILDGRKKEPHTYAGLIRYEARSRLEREESGEWSVNRKLTNCGIQITCGPVVLRVRMSKQGNLPHPGRSHALQEFYEQVPLALDIDGIRMTSTANLILVYTIDSKQQLALFLCKPRGGSEADGISGWHWKRRVKIRPDEGIVFEPSDTEEFDFGDMEEDVSDGESESA